MFQSRMFITTATRFLILIGIIVSVHGKAQNQDAYSPVFGSFNKRVDVFEEGSIDNCLTTITAKTHDERVANENINFQLKDDIPYFEINNNGCLKIKPGITISKTNDNPTLPVVVIAADTRYPQLSNEITININFTSSDTNVNRKLIKIQSSYWFEIEHDDDDDDDNDDDKKNVIGIPETIEHSEPIMTVSSMTENVVYFTSLNDKHGIFRFENHQVYVHENKLDFKTKNGIGMRDFDLIIVATNDQHQYQYRKIKIKTLRSRGLPPTLGPHKSVLLIDEETFINGCICQLDVEDPDREIGSTIYFEIIKPTNYFSINERGCIKLKETLDRECMMSDHNCLPSHLIVVAFFEGHFLESVVSIDVLINDVNDHAPELEMKHATVYEREKSKFIAKLIAIDRDSNETNGNAFSYEINNFSHYPDGKKFVIKNHNELYNNEPLYVNGRKTNEHEISIMIKDNGKPRKSNTSIFTVEVKKKNSLKFIQSQYVVFISEHGEIDTPVTEYFWVKNNSGPVKYKIFQTDLNNYYSVAQFYDSDMNIYYGQIVVHQNFSYRGKRLYVDLHIKASDKFSYDILTVRIYHINANKPAIKLNLLGNSYSKMKQIAKNSVECIATVRVSDGILIKDNRIQYTISKASSERYIGLSTYSEEVVKSLFVKIDKDNGCIQIQKNNGHYHNELMVVRAYYKQDDSPKPVISRHLINIRLVNSNNQMYNVTVTDAMENGN